MKRDNIRRGVAIMLACAVSSVLCAAESVVKTSMVGHWDGSARIIVSWCTQQMLPVALDLHADGTVTGKVGDADLTNGRFSRNRGWLGRKLNFATDYIVRGDLNGAVVAAEGISRAGVSIPLNFRDGRFTGGLHTTGSKFGGKETMILSASALKLSRK
jgi:hypothetical protein